MAAPAKKRNVDFPTEKPSEEDIDERGENESLSDKMEIQVDFEGRNPTDSDFHGIKQLLNQLFLKTHLNLTELTELIIGQNYIGSVIKQSEVDDDPDEESDQNDVFGVTTVINLTNKKELECICNLRALILKLSSEYGSAEVAAFIRNLFLNDSKPVGLLINERFVNIPFQITIPLLKSLKDELRRAVEKKMANDFSYLILICKLYKMEDGNNKKKSKKAPKNNVGSEIIWSNPEEEIIDQDAEVWFEFSVKDEADYGLVGEWKENDEKMIPMRRVLVIPFNKFDKIIKKVEEAVAA